MCSFKISEETPFNFSLKFFMFSIDLPMAKNYIVYSSAVKEIWSCLIRTVFYFLVTGNASGMFAFTLAIIYHVQHRLMNLMLFWSCQFYGYTCRNWRRKSLCVWNYNVIMHPLNRFQKIIGYLRWKILINKSTQCIIFPTNL